MRRVANVVGTMLILVGLVSGCSDLSVPSDSTTAPVTSVSSDEPDTVPVEQDVVGMNLDAAETLLKGAGWTVTTHDTVESRSVWNSSNWVVVDQTANGTEMDLGVKKKSDGEPSTDPTSTEETKDAADEPVEEDTEPKLTLAQQNAVGSANQYLNYTSFSRQGLIEQLEYEGYSKKQAAFAVDYVAPNWKKQAAKKAQEYLDYSSFSRQGLIEQLEYEGFTSAEAKHGAKAVGY